MDVLAWVLDRAGDRCWPRGLELLGMSGLCFACKLPADDEYGWIRDDGMRETWILCEDHCEFAVDVVESISNLEWEVERWATEQT